MSSVDRKDMVNEELQKTKESDYINNISVRLLHRQLQRKIYTLTQLQFREPL